MSLMKSCAFFLGVDPLVLPAGTFNVESSLSETGYRPAPPPFVYMMEN